MVQSVASQGLREDGESDALARRRARWVGAAVLAGFGARVTAAIVIEIVARKRGTLCLFGDTAIYWHLAEAIRGGAPYVVPQYGVPHFALRTPGYPLFLAGVFTFFGSSTLVARVAQAALGAASVWVAARLVDSLVSGGHARTGAGVWTAWIVALEPYSVAMCGLLLTEALFVPLMLLGLYGLAVLTRGVGLDSTATGRGILASLATGAAHGAAILARPSWALAAPVLLVGCVAVAAPRRRWDALRWMAVVALGVGIVMSPWWVRNARIFGRFVPTALWLGASLYDGLNPEAGGLSDMRFLDAPEVREMDEVTQDRVLMERAVAFARANPARVGALAVAKAARFWSPWPQAEGIGSAGLAGLSGAIVVPIYALIVAGAWIVRRDGRALLLLLGPLLLFAAVHLVFVGSIRYRVPVEVPALGLAGIALAAVRSRARGARGSET